MNKIPLFAIFLLLFLAGCTYGNQITGHQSVDPEQTATCSDVTIDFVSISGKSSVCHENGFIRFNIENKGKEGVTGIIVEVDGAKSTVMKKISTGEIISERIAFAINPDSISATPIAANGLICTRSKIIFRGVYSCK